MSECVADDIIVHGKDDEDHDEKLDKLLQECRKKGTKLKLRKCIFKSAEIPFLGHIVAKDGLKIDSTRIDAICKLPKPENPQALRRFIGLVTYLSRFVPSLSNTLAPLLEI